MTKEELDVQKEIEKYFTESAGFGRDKIQNFMDIVNKALKQKGEQIAELDMKRKAERKIFQGIVEKKNDQLTKAKEIIQLLLNDFLYLCDMTNNSSCYESIGEAEQSLNSEVEK